MATEKINVTFEVTKATASRMEIIRRWLDPKDEKIWDINHYAKIKFMAGFQKDDQAKKDYDKQQKAQKDIMSQDVAINS